MAITFSLTDGTTTVQLNSSGIMTLPTYQLSTPEVDDTLISNLGDGDTLATGPWRNVTETIPLLITGATDDAVVALIRSIEMMLDKARQNRATWRGVRVWFQAQFDHDSAIWRSEVLAGRLVHDHIADSIWRTKVETSLLITRRYFWEGALTQLELSSAGTGTPTTGYVTFYNDDDTDANTNWIQVAAAQVTGVLPTPLLLEINNNSGSTYSIRDLYIGNYVHMDAANIDPILRVEDELLDEETWAFAGEHETYRWLLPAALTADTNGQYARILLAMASIPTNIALMRAKLESNFGGPTFLALAMGEQTTYDSRGLIDLGAFPIPPGGVGVGNTALYLTVTMTAGTAAGSTVAADWAQIMPTGDGLLRRISALVGSISLESGWSLVDNGIEGYVYVQAGSDIYQTGRGIHSPIHVWPGVTNRLRIIKTGNGPLGAGETYRARAWLRPRRLTI